MVKRNTNMAKLTAGYLFPEINRRKREFLQKNPGAQIISLGIGNTTEPLTPHVVEGLRKEVDRLSTREGYSGYGDEQGINEFRAQLAEKLYGGLVKGDEVFISDGAKCDIARLQTMFGSEVAIAVQDPSYPVYVDGSVIEMLPRKRLFSGSE
jgi:LL-diaminopimelate aminotransferase